MGGFAEFDAYVRGRAHEYVDELKALIRQPTVSAQGIGVEDTATLVLERARRAGIGAEALRADGGPPTLVGETGRGDRTLLAYNHYDVQPPDPLDEGEAPPVVRPSGVGSRASRTSSFASGARRKMRTALLRRSFRTRPGVWSGRSRR